MNRFRLVLIAAIIWLVIFFNIERPEVIFGIENIDLSTLVYVMGAVVMGGILMMPQLAKLPFYMIFVPVLFIYALGKALITYNIGLEADTLFFYVMITEIVALFITLVIVRAVSVSITNFEETVKHAALGSKNLRVLDMDAGKEAIVRELLRARQYKQTVTLIHIHVQPPSNKTSFLRHLDPSASFRRHYLRTQLAKLVEGLFDKSDVVMWHGDNLVVCMPQTSRLEAISVIRELYMLFKMMEVESRIGFAEFPQKALIFEDLVEAAQNFIWMPTQEMPALQLEEESFESKMEVV